MKVTALEEYGLRCLVLLAKRGQDQPMSLSEIGDSEQVSVPYAAKLLALLKQGGLVRALRGRSGGYVLAKSAEDITLAQVFRALGEPLFSGGHCERFTASGQRHDCVHFEDCTVRDVWSSFQVLMNEVLDHVTLADVAVRSGRGGLGLLELAAERGARRVAAG